MGLASTSRRTTHPTLSDRRTRLHRLRPGSTSRRRDGAKPSILSILGQRNFWGIAMPRFLADPTWGTLTFWLPLYLTTVRGISI